MKKFLVGFIIFSFIFTISCEKPTNDEVFYDMQKKLNNLDSYSCSAIMTIKGNKSAKKYEAIQIFKNPNKYIIEFSEPMESKGYRTIYNGKQLWFYHPKINESMIIRDYEVYHLTQNMFIGYFMKFFISNEESDIEVETIEDNEYFVLKTNLPGNNKYRTVQKLWINSKNFIPYKMITLDEKGNISVLVEFKNFKYDIKINEDAFDIKI